MARLTLFFYIACRPDDNGQSRGTARAVALDWDSATGLAALAEPPLDLIVASGAPRPSKSVAVG